MKEHFDIVFKILLLAVLVWIAIEIRAIYVPHEIDVNAKVSNGYTNFGVELSR